MNRRGELGELLFVRGCTFFLLLFSSIRQTFHFCSRPDRPGRQAGERVGIEESQLLAVVGGYGT